MEDKKNKVSSVTNNSDTDSIKEHKRTNSQSKFSASKSQIGKSQTANMELTKSEFARKIKNDHFGSDSQDEVEVIE
jgi:hypothetical protein